MDVAIKEKKLANNNHWKYIIVRAIVFFKDCRNGKWSLEIWEFKHTFDEAIKFNELFSENDGKLLKNLKFLIGDGCKNEIKEARENFLKLNIALKI